MYLGKSKNERSSFFSFFTISACKLLFSCSAQTLPSVTRVGACLIVAFGSATFSSSVFILSTVHDFAFVFVVFASAYRLVYPMYGRS